MIPWNIFSVVKRKVKADLKEIAILKAFKEHSKHGTSQFFVPSVPLLICCI